MNLGIFRHFKQNSLLDGGGDGGSGSGDGAGDSGDAGSGSTDGAATGGQGSGSSDGSSWRDSLPDDLKGNESLAKYGSVEDLSHAYINASSLIGSDKMAIPGDKSSDEQWNETFQKLGLPADRNAYGVERAADSVINEDFHKSFLDVAHSQGVLPKQAKALLDSYSTMVTDANSKILTDKTAQESADVAGLKTEWGEAFSRKAEAANYALTEFGGEEARKFINDSGLGTNPHIMKLLAAVGEAKSDDVFRGETGDAFGVSADEAQAEMNNMLADANSPIHDTNHINHAKAKKEYNRLAAKAFVKK